MRPVRQSLSPTYGTRRIAADESTLLDMGGCSAEACPETRRADTPKDNLEPSDSGPQAVVADGLREAHLSSPARDRPGSERTFYNFVPYDFGPFSFTLYWDLGSLRQNGYVTNEEERIALCGRTLELAARQAEELPASIQSAVADILTRYGKLSQRALIREVYRRYPWFALNSKLPERNSVSVPRPKKARPAVYTAGYEGRSVDAFFNDLLTWGIHVVVDVRANPVSRKYGFSGLRLVEFCKKLGLQYRHKPTLGFLAARVPA